LLPDFRSPDSGGVGFQPVRNFCICSSVKPSRRRSAKLGNPACCSTASSSSKVRFTMSLNAPPTSGTPAVERSIPVDYSPNPRRAAIRDLQLLLASRAQFAQPVTGIRFLQWTAEPLGLPGSQANPHIFSSSAIIVRKTRCFGSSAPVGLLENRCAGSGGAEWTAFSP